MSKLTSKSALILSLITEGHSYSQIVDGHPDLNYLDIFAAAEEALQVSESHSDYAERRRRSSFGIHAHTSGGRALRMPNWRRCTPRELRFKRWLGTFSGSRRQSGPELPEWVKPYRTSTEASAS